MDLTGYSDGYLIAMAGLWLGLPAGMVLFVRGRLWKSPRRLVRAAAGPLLALWTLLALLTVSETVFALSYDETDSFGMSKVCTRWYQRHVQRNNLGFRDRRDFFPGKTGSNRRLLILGDSFTFGHGVEDEADRFGDRLERLARDESLDWVFYNMAQSGLSTEGELNILRRINEYGFEHDAVLLVYCINDVEDLSPESARRVGTVILDRPTNVLLCESYLLNFLYYRIRQYGRPEFQRYFSWMQDAYRGDEWNRQRTRLDQIRALCRRQGIPLFVVTFPLLYDLGPDYEYEQAHRLLDEYWRAHGVPHLDLLETLRAHRHEGLVVNRFDAHPNARAHELAAAAIWKDLLADELRAIETP